MSKLLAIDPGLATGWARFIIADNRIVEVTAGEMSPQQFYATMFGSFSLCTPTEDRISQFVYERFTIGTETGKKTQAPWSLELIGLMKAFAHVYGVPIKDQSASEAKSFDKNGGSDKLRDYGLWVRGGAGHARDAMRHGLLFIAATYGLAPLNAWRDSKPPVIVCKL